MLGTCWGHGKPPAAFKGGGFWPHLGCWTPQVRVGLNVFGYFWNSGVLSQFVMIPLMGFHWESHKSNDGAVEGAGKIPESSS